MVAATGPTGRATQLYKVLECIRSSAADAKAAANCESFGIETANVVEQTIGSFLRKEAQKFPLVISL